MSNPLTGDVHVNTPLSNISVALMQNASNFVADSIFPNIPVSKQSDLYYTYDRGHFNRNEMAERAPGTESAGSGYELGDDNYYCRVYAFHHDIADETRANADSMLSMDREATSLVTNKALIFREANWASTFFKTSVWGTDLNGHATLDTGNNRVFWDIDSSTPIEHIRAAVDAMLGNTGFLPNTLVLGRAVLTALLDHPDIIDRLKYGQSSGNVAATDLSDLAALFKIDRIFVMNAIQNTAAEGATNAHSFIADSKSALLCYSAPTPGLMTPTAGYSFSWNGFMGSSASGSRIKKFRMDNLNSDRVEIDMAYTPKLVSAELGTYLDNIVQ